MTIGTCARRARRGEWTRFALAVGAGLQPGLTLAQEAAPSEDAIVVVAPPSERVSIDRTTYVVKDNPEARSSNLLEILGRIPFVDVNAEGQVRLMGVAGVTILVDGKAVAGDLPTVLRSLRGSRIAKVEVISSPSAAFSAAGSGGIINIITRTSFAAGFGGSATAKGGNYGVRELNLAPTWTRHKLSVSATLNLGRSAARNRVERNSARTAAPFETISESSGYHSSNRSESAELQLSYKLSATETLTASASNWHHSARRPSVSDIRLAGADTLAYRRTRRAGNEGNWRAASAGYAREGPRKGEKLDISFKASAAPQTGYESYSSVSAGGGVSLFSITSRNRYSTLLGKVDYVRPVAKDRSLSLGATVERVSGGQLREQAGEISPGRPAVEGVVDLSGGWTEAAAYATYQMPLLGGTVLTGLRLESRDYRFTAGTPSAPKVERLLAFPSLHVERKLGKKVTFSFSYSRRVGWPYVFDLDPVLRFGGPLDAYVGNPLLEPEITNAFEAKLQLVLGRHNAALSGYSRATSHAFSQAAELDARGVLITRPINLGQRMERGASLSLRGPLLRGLSYTFSGNLAEQETRAGLPADGFGGSSPQYEGSAQLDYRDGREGRRGADHVTLMARYQGPYRDPFVRWAAYFTSEASWSHAISDRFSALLKAEMLTGSAEFRYTYRSAETVSTYVSRSHGPRVSLALTRSLGPRPSE